MKPSQMFHLIASLNKCLAVTFLLEPYYALTCLLHCYVFLQSPLLLVRLVETRYIYMLVKSEYYEPYSMDNMNWFLDYCMCWSFDFWVRVDVKFGKLHIYLLYLMAYKILFHLFLFSQHLNYGLNSKACMWKNHLQKLVNSLFTHKKLIILAIQKIYIFGFK